MEKSMYRSIVAPIDVSVPEISAQIFARALFHLKHSDCQVHLLSIAAPGANETQLDELTSQLMEFAEQHCSQHEDRVHLHTLAGQPSEKIIEFSEKNKADLVLIGSHRQSSLLGRAALGSTAAKVATQSPCDVCIVKTR